MRVFLSLGLGVGLLVVAPSCAPPAPPPSVAAAAAPCEVLSNDVCIRALGHGTYVVVNSSPWPANSVVVEMVDGSIVIVDTPYTVRATKTELTWIRHRFGTRHVVAINTHFHPDRLGGNEALIEDGIPTYGSDLTVKMLNDRGERVRKEIVEHLEDAGPKAPRELIQEFKNARLVAPDHVFPAREGLTLPFGRETVVVHHPGPAHSPDNVVVYFKEKKLLVGGCAIVAADRIGNRSDADMDHWPEAVKDLEQFPAETVIPGHGDSFSPSLLRHTLDLLGAK